MSEQLEQPTPTLHAIHQPCKNCVFAQYNTFDPDMVKPTQYGCSLKKLEAFVAKAPGCTIEAEDAEAAFIIINNRKCHFFRDRRSQWASKTPVQEYAEQVRKEVTMKVDIVIVVDDNETTDTDVTLEKLRTTLVSLQEQKVKPNRVFVVNNSGTLRAGKLQQFLNKHAVGLNIYRTDIHVRVEGKHIHPLACVDEVFSKTTGHFYATFRPGFVIPPEFVESIDVAINERMDQFVVLLPVDEDLNGMVAQRGFHKTYEGNAPGYGIDTRVEVPEGQQPERVLLPNLAAKAAFFANIYERPDMFAKVTDVCPTMNR